MKILLFFFLVFSFQVGAQSNLQDRLLWEITGENLDKPSYLFGSIHSNDKRVFNFYDSVYVALDKVDQIVLETDILSVVGDFEVRSEISKLNYDNKGNPYSQKLEPTKTTYGDEDGMPQFLDAFFQKFAYNSKKEFKILETLEFQLTLAPDLSEVDFSKVNFSALLSDENDMVKSYVKGDIDYLLKLMELNFNFVPSYLDQLLFNRNKTMADSLDIFLSSNKSIFCAVGAGHLAGPKGLIEKLRFKGYNLRQVNGMRSESNELKKKVLQHRTYNYQNDTLDFQITFGSKPKVMECDQCELKLGYSELGQGNTYLLEVHSFEAGLSEKEILNYLPSPEVSPVVRDVDSNGDNYFEGIADAYPEGVYWSRMYYRDNKLYILKAYGGNKFMNSKRSISFFNQFNLIKKPQ